MFTCPHCGKPGISTRKRLFRWHQWQPLVCHFCQGKSNEDGFKAVLFESPFLLVTVGLVIFGRQLLEDPVWGLPVSFLVPITFFACFFLESSPPILFALHSSNRLYYQWMSLPQRAGSKRIRPQSRRRPDDRIRAFAAATSGRSR
jgi:hypothetical protein